MEKKKITRLALMTLGVLLIPFFAGLLTKEVNWNLFDYVAAGVLIIGTGLAYQFISSKAINADYRLGAALAVGTPLLLIWINLAVGIIGNEDNPANALYFGVLLVWLIGVFLSRFKAEGMSKAMVGAAITQMAIPVIALLVFKPDVTQELIGVVQVFGLSAFFAILFIGSALMFKRSTEVGASNT